MLTRSKSNHSSDQIAPASLSLFLFPQHSPTAHLLPPILLLIGGILSQSLLERLLVGAKEHPPVCAIIGGILGQEVISGKGDLLRNFFFYDAMVEKVKLRTLQVLVAAFATESLIYLEVKQNRIKNKERKRQYEEMLQHMKSFN